jgi:hypothetical protein
MRLTSLIQVWRIQHLYQDLLLSGHHICPHHAGASFTTLQTTTPSIPTPASSSRLIVSNIPTDDPTFTVPLAPTSRPPKGPGSSTRQTASVDSLVIPPPAIVNSNELTEEGAALILRLCNRQALPADIAQVFAIMSGRNESTAEEAQLLWRLHNLNVPPEDISIIVNAMQRR